ncbi:MAG: hemoglobin/transferrin/lactoferrin receptor protein [Algoriphagus sp.]|jgi:hemoglobin/transferrin/lactoferrin receptor protein
MKTNGLFLLTFLFTSFSYCQQIRIIDSETQQNLPGVIIYTSSPANFILSNNEGEAELSTLRKEGSIYFELLGYATVQLSISELVAIDYLIQMKSGLMNLDQAVVSASRWRQNSKDVSSKVSVLKAENLLLRNPANTADWLGSSGEIFVQKSQQGGGSPMIRGFSANRLLYSVDGVRMNTAIFRSGNLHNVISLDPFALASTEILFGPGSVMYGSDAIGGVMSFQTLDPSFSSQNKWSGTFSSRFGSANNEFTGHAHVAFESKKWAFLTSLTRFDYGDLKMGGFGPAEYLRPFYLGIQDGVDSPLQNPDPKVQITSGYDQFNIMQKIKFKASEQTELSYGFHYSQTGYVPRYDRLIESGSSGLHFAVWSYGPQIWMMNNFGIMHRSESKLFDQVDIKIAHQYFEESRIDRRVGNLNQNIRTEKVQAYSANTDFVKNIQKESFISYGMELIYNDVTSEGYRENISSQAISPATTRYPQSSWVSAAIYGSLHTELSEQLKFQTGVRYNYIGLNANYSINQEFYPLPFSTSSSNFGALTGSLGLIYSPEPSFTISPNLSTGFRAPNVDDVGKIFDSQPGSVIVPNPELKPEYAYNAELNVNKHFNQSFKFDLSGYYTILKDAMVRRPFKLNGESVIDYDAAPSNILAIQNAAFAEVVGIQAGFELAITRHFLFTSRYNWQKGTEELDDETTSPSRHAAPAFGMTRLTFAKGNLKFVLTSQYSTEVAFENMPVEEKGKPQLYAKDLNGKPYSPSWTIFNLNSSYQLFSFLEINAGIENIRDLRYRPYSSGLTAPGRNFTFSVRGSF